MRTLKILALGAGLAACGPTASPSHLQIARPLEVSEEERALGAFVVSLENKGTEFCTGVLVTPRTVLTAAHCFLREKSLPDLSVRMGSRAYAVRALQTLADSDGKVSDDYLPNFDIAIVSIEDVQPSPAAFPRLMSGPEANLFINHEGLLAGYGMTGSGEGDMGTLRFGRARIKSVATRGRYTGLMVVDSAIQSGPCAGDSGGPLFVKKDGEWLIAGLVHGVNWYANPSFFGEDPCAFDEATYTMPGVFIDAEKLADAGEVQLIDTPPSADPSHDWLDLCETQALAREDLLTFKLLTLKFRFKSCAEIQQALSHKPIALDFGTSPLRSVQVLSRIPVSTLKADLSRVEQPGQPLPYLEDATATVATQAQLDFILGAEGLKKLSLSPGADRGLDYRALASSRELVDLRLNGMQISHLPPLSLLRNLRHLELSRNSLENLDFLSGTGNLQYLNVSSNRIGNISALADLRKMAVLILSNNRITDISALKELPAVEQLSLVNNPIIRKICPYFEDQEGDICAF